MKAVILLASQSKNLFPFTQTIPKSLINIAGKTILDTLIEQIKSIGISEILFVVGYKKDEILNRFGYGNKYGLKISYVTQDNPTKIGDGIMTAKTFLKNDREFLLLYGDILSIQSQFSKLMTVHQTDSEKSVAAVSHSPVVGNYNSVYIDSEMTISKLASESASKKISNYVLAGAFILKTTIFDALATLDFDLVAYYTKLIENKCMKACLWEKFWIDISYPWDILSANQMIMNHWNKSEIGTGTFPEKDVHITGPVVIGNNVKIKAGTIINGPCHIGDNSFIGNNVLLRQFANIGENTTIGYGTEIKNSTVFAGSRIGRLSFIGDSVIGQKVNMGSYSMTVNYNTSGENIYFKGSSEGINTPFKKLGSFIGDTVCIGSNHSIKPGLIIPPGAVIPDNITIGQETVNQLGSR